MSYRDKKTVIGSITSRRVSIHGRDYELFEAFLGMDPLDGSPKKISSTSERKLRDKINEFYKNRAVGGDFGSLLTPQQMFDARRAFDYLAEHGMPNASLYDMVVNQKTLNIKNIPSITIGEAFAKYYKAQEGKSFDHVKAVRIRVGSFVESIGSGRKIADLTAKEIVDDLEKRLFFDKTEEQKTTYNNALNYIKTFLFWCASDEQAIISKNPLENVKQKVKEWKDPEYLHANDCRALFEELKKRPNKTDLACAVLSFFCGMRQAEIYRAALGPSAVVFNLEERFVRVVKCKGSTKGIHPRVFTIPDTAYAWMKSFDFSTAITKASDVFRDHLNIIAKKIGINIPKNAGRHTFCTMHDAVFHDSNLLTSIVGNSEDVRSKHYNGLATAKEGREYFAILP